MTKRVSTRRFFPESLALLSYALLAASVWAGDVNLRDWPRQEGEQDDAARIRRGLAAVGEEGGELFLPSGVYLLDSLDPDLTVPRAHILIKGRSNIVIRGAGPATLLRTVAGSLPGNYQGDEPILLKIVGSEDIYVKNLRFQGEGKGYGFDCDAGSAVTILDSKAITVEECHFKDLNCAIGKGSPSHCRFINNRITGRIAQDAVMARSYCIVTGNIIDGGENKSVMMGIRVEGEYTTVANNIIRQTTAEPIVVEGFGRSLAIVGNVIENLHTVEHPSSYGIIARDLRTSTIVGNTLSGCTLELQAAGNAGRKVEANVVVANTICESHGQGIYVAATGESSSANWNLLANNSIADSGNRGIQVNGRAEYTSAMGNHIIRPKEHAISWSSAFGNVTGNLIFEPLCSGFWTEPKLPPVMGILISGNKFFGADLGWGAMALFGENDAYVVNNDIAGFGPSHYGSGTRQDLIFRRLTKPDAEIDPLQRTLPTPALRPERIDFPESSLPRELFFKPSRLELQLY